MNSGSGKKDKNQDWDIKRETQKDTFLTLEGKGLLSEETEKRSHGLERHVRMERAKVSAFSGHVTRWNHRWGAYVVASTQLCTT